MRITFQDLVDNIDAVGSNGLAVSFVNDIRITWKPYRGTKWLSGYWFWDGSDSTTDGLKLVNAARSIQVNGEELGDITKTGKRTYFVV